MAILISSDVLGLTFDQAKAEFEREFLGRVLRRHTTITDAAKSLGMDRTHLHRKINQLGIARDIVYTTDGPKPKR